MSDPTRANEATGARRSGWVVWVATAIWLAAFAGGTAALLRFEFTPGDESRAPLVWRGLIPPSPTGGHDAGAVRASALRLHARQSGRVAGGPEPPIAPDHRSSRLRPALRLHGPGDAHESWEKAGCIPGIERRIDREGVEARRFGALVSGYTVLYDASGKLLFEGGVTGSRGQVGANAGRTSVIGFLRNDKGDTSRTPVFGCYLFDRAERILHSSHSHGA